jgi:predicted O-methyltransferase YrrM
MVSTLFSSDRKVVTIEINKSIADTARKNVAEAGLSEKIEVMIGNALDAIPTLDRKFQLMCSES